MVGLVVTKKGCLLFRINKKKRASGEQNTELFNDATPVNFSLEAYSRAVDQTRQVLLTKGIQDNQVHSY